MPRGLYPRRILLCNLLHANVMIPRHARVHRAPGTTEPIRSTYTYQTFTESRVDLTSFTKVELLRGQVQFTSSSFFGDVDNWHQWHWRRCEGTLHLAADHSIPNLETWLRGSVQSHTGRVGMSVSLATGQ